MTKILEKRMCCGGEAAATSEYYLFIETKETESFTRSPCVSGRKEDRLSWRRCKAAMKGSREEHAAAFCGTPKISKANIIEPSLSYK